MWMKFYLSFWNILSSREFRDSLHSTISSCVSSFFFPFLFHILFPIISLISPIYFLLNGKGGKIRRNNKNEFLPKRNEREKMSLSFSSFWIFFFFVLFSISSFPKVEGNIMEYYDNFFVTFSFSSFSSPFSSTDFFRTFKFFLKSWKIHQHFFQSFFNRERRVENSGIIREKLCHKNTHRKKMWLFSHFPFFWWKKERGFVLTSMVSSFDNYGFFFYLKK